MKILFILASTPEISLKVALSENRRYPIMAPSSTLLTLAELARSGGHEVELLDTRLYMTKPSDPRGAEWDRNLSLIEEQIKNSAAEIVGISFLSSSALEGYKIAALCQKHGKTVVGGGLHVTVAEAEAREQGSFDYIYQGEAESTFLTFLENLENGNLPRTVSPTRVIHAEVVRLQEMNKIRAISDFSYYRDAIAQHPIARSIYVELSRGCVKNCTFCEVAKGGLAFAFYRPIPLTEACKTVDTAVNLYNINYILVSDSVATLKKTHFLEFMRYVRTTHPDVTVQFNSTVDHWTEEIARSVQGMKCNVWFGFESGSQRILDLIKKGTTVDQANDAAKICADNGIKAGFNILLGIPHENRQDYEETVSFFERNKTIFPNPNILNPLPGTEMYASCIKNDLLRRQKDYSIWTHDRIRDHDLEGPVKNVDYRMVLEYYDKYSELQNEPARDLSVKI